MTGTVRNSRSDYKCDCDDLRDRRWNPNTGLCETCRRRYLPPPKDEVHVTKTRSDDLGAVFTPADAAAMEEMLTRGTPGDWSLWTSNSYRRISSTGDGDVLHGSPARDGVSDLAGNNSKHDLPLIIALHNFAPKMLAELRRLWAQEGKAAALERELENVGKGQDRAEGLAKELHAENLELREHIFFLRDEATVFAGRTCRFCCTDLETYVTQPCAIHAEVNKICGPRDSLFEAADRIAEYLDAQAARPDADVVAIDLYRTTAAQVRHHWEKK